MAFFTSVHTINKHATSGDLFYKIDLKQLINKNHKEKFKIVTSNKSQYFAKPKNKNIKFKKNQCNIESNAKSRINFKKLLR